MLSISVTKWNFATVMTAVMYTFQKSHRQSTTGNLSYTFPQTPGDTYIPIQFCRAVSLILGKHAKSRASMIYPRHPGVWRARVGRPVFGSSYLEKHVQLGEITDRWRPSRDTALLAMHLLNRSLNGACTVDCKHQRYGGAG